MYSFKEDPEGVKGKNVKNGNGLSSCKVGCRKQTGWELGLVPPFRTLFKRSLYGCLSSCGGIGIPSAICSHQCCKIATHCFVVAFLY